MHDYTRNSKNSPALHNTIALIRLVYQGGINSHARVGNCEI
jgi:hypothetical protein